MGVAWGQDEDGEAGGDARAEHAGAGRVTLNLSGFNISSQWRLEGSGSGGQEASPDVGATPKPPRSGVGDGRKDNDGGGVCGGGVFELTIHTGETCLNCQVVECC